MQLLFKITLWYIGIVTVIMAATMLIARNNIASEIKRAEVERLTAKNESLALQMQQAGLNSLDLAGQPVNITRWNGPIPSPAVTVEESTAFNQSLSRNDHRLTVSSYYKSGNEVYRISSYNYITRTYLIWGSMLKSLAWKLLLIIIGVTIAATLISRYMLSPFRKTMEALRSFNITQKKRLQLTRTSTKEFQELNRFLQDMTDKAIAEYAAVKEFSENASHELQTPLAVVQSKLELLTETRINETQAALMADMQKAIEKLSRINRSLTLLTKLENHEFEPLNIKFCRIVKDQLAQYADRIMLKNITVTQQLDKNIHINIHPSLADILVSNLLGNAIRHNIDGGAILVTLTPSQLRISNTGLPPELPTEELFQRFKKSNQSAESTGLGLAIVKQICKTSDFTARYEYEEGWHHLIILFDKPESKTEDVKKLTGQQAGVNLQS